MSEMLDKNKLYFKPLEELHDSGYKMIEEGYDMSDVKECHFTQSEIDRMETGSYEKKEVEP